jgi:hypothetical protein
MDTSPAPKKDDMPQTETFGVTPGSPLMQLLEKLSRPDRRLLLAMVTAPPSKRRAKLEKRMRARLHALGIA